MSLKRREFIKLGGAGLVLAGLEPERFFALQETPLNPASPFYEQLVSDEFPFPYDDKVFSCAERIFNVRRDPADPQCWLTDLNLLVKDGKKLDIKVLIADRREDLAAPRETAYFTGVERALDILLRGYDGPRLHYQVQYREGSGGWRALPPRSFKLPNSKLQDGGRMQVFFIADDHNFDDADYGVPAEYKQTKISGDYVVDFLRNLKNNPKWEPEWPLNKLKFGFTLAKAVRYILASGDPDFAVNLGDSNGIGSNYRWENWGLPFKNLTDKDYDFIAKTLWLRMRKVFSGLTPNMPVYMALGNHDGDENWNAARFRAKFWRQKLFTFPDKNTYPEGGHPDGNYHAFSWGSDQQNRGGVQFIILDVTGFTGTQPKKVDDWTLGAEQVKWFENVLSHNEHEWSFACFHHVLGGWPAGPIEEEKTLAYGRGPLFTDKDYAGYGDPAKIEQVKLTELGKECGLRAFIYGHDHIFKVTRISEGLDQKDMSGVCCGSTKHIGEIPWWQGSYWQKHYGNGFKSIPDFWGPSGITRLTIKSDQARFDYICTARTPYTNLPSGGVEGSIVSSAILVNPAPSIIADKKSLVFQMTDENVSLPPQNLKIRNGGGRTLSFTVKPVQDWIKVSPERGSAWGGWSDVAVSLSAENLDPGYHEGTIRTESPGAGNHPIEIQVKFNPAPFILADKKSFAFETDETSLLPPPPQNLKIRNGGGQDLNYTLKPSQDWIKVSSEKGSSRGSWTEAAISFLDDNLTPGSYNGTITIECPEASNHPVLVQVQAVIRETPLYAPLNFSGMRIGGVFSASREDMIVLTWQENRLNTNVQKYRLYVFNDKGNRTLLGEAGPRVFKYTYRRARKDKSYRFAVTAVNSRNREGEAATTSVDKAI